MQDDWLDSIFNKILDNPIRNIIILIVVLIVIYYLGVEIYEAFGIITAVGYVFACIYGLARIIDKPNRALVWAVGYMIGAIIIPIGLESVLPILNQRDWSSLIALIVIGIVLLMLYLKARELKKY